WVVMVVEKGHLEKDCRAILPCACNDFLQNATCYGCSEKGHLKNKCLKAGNQHNEGALPGRNACEIKTVNQEDAGLNVEMAKVIFAKGIWSYVCKMDNALQKYSDVRRRHLTSVVSAITLVQKVQYNSN
ncbi:zinc finger, RING/FYVE/PHD-type, transmembrane fragile-X-F-associated protein, partial [Tanacetum coccineum]